MQGAINQVKSASHQQGAVSSLAAFGLAGGATADASDRPWGMGVPLRPKFGSRQTHARRDPTRAGWLLQATGAGGESVSLASAPPLRAARLARKSSSCGGGCGCRSCQGRKR